MAPAKAQGFSLAAGHSPVIFSGLRSEAIQGLRAKLHQRVTRFGQVPPEYSMRGIAKQPGGVAMIRCHGETASSNGLGRTDD